MQYVPDDIRAVIQAYGEQPVEDWRAEHDAAMACAELDERLEFALGLFEALERLRVRQSDALDVAEHPALVRALRPLYLLWLAPCGALERTLRDAEALGQALPHARQFRDALDIASAWRAPIEVLTGERDIGPTTPAAEVRRALEGRVR